MGPLGHLFPFLYDRELWYLFYMSRECRFSGS